MLAGAAETSELQSSLLGRQFWLRHGFGTRHTPYPAAPLALAQQIHSAKVLDVCGAGPAGEGDALITSAPGLAIGVKTADCFPILLADPRKSVIAAVHAGWRGTAKNIVQETLLHMRERFGTVPSDVIAAIGPGIGKCCFEVGPEVAREFATWIPSVESAPAKTTIDLQDVLQRQLLDGGVFDGNIEFVGPCTVCSNDLLFSFRREKETAGRMLAWIALAPPQQNERGAADGRTPSTIRK